MRKGHVHGIKEKKKTWWESNGERFQQKVGNIRKQRLMFHLTSQRPHNRLPEMPGWRSAAASHKGELLNQHPPIIYPSRV